MIVLQLILLVFTTYINLSSTISTNLSISESQDDSFQNGIITTDIGKLVLYNSHYIFPLQLFYAELDSSAPSKAYSYLRSALIKCEAQKCAGRKTHSIIGAEQTLGRKTHPNHEGRLLLQP